MNIILLYIYIIIINICIGDIIFNGIEGETFNHSNALYNGKLLNTTLNLKSNIKIIIYGYYWVCGGIYIENVSNITIMIDGTLKFTEYIKDWPITSEETIKTGGHKPRKYPVMECIEFVNTTDIIITSSINRGILDGSGYIWWGELFLGYLIHEENRPRLLKITHSSNIVLEYILFIHSPYWTFWGFIVDNLIIRYCQIYNKRSMSEFHSLYDITAFNTDGFDVSGKNIHMHDLIIWTQDDCIAIKDYSENVLIERVNASGYGLTIGSIGSSYVRNITFRHCYLLNSVKGIYMKFRSDRGSIQDIIYSDIIIENNQGYPIWIGPAQQSDSKNPCYANPCSLCWPIFPCNPVQSQFKNIFLYNISIIRPHSNLGVIYGHPNIPIQNIIFNNVSLSTKPYLNIQDTFPSLDYIQVETTSISFIILFYFISCFIIIIGIIICILIYILCMIFFTYFHIYGLIYLLLFYYYWFWYPQELYILCKNVIQSQSILSFPIPYCFDSSL